MAYTPIDPTTPNSTQVGTAFGNSAKSNILALRDAAIWGMIPGSGYFYSQSGGTNGEPTSITAGVGTERVVSDVSWADGQITQLVSKYYVSAGATAEVASTANFSYSAGEITAASGIAMGPFIKLLPLLGKVKDLLARFATHSAATTGASAHGLGSIASQASNNVSITGGNITGTTFGSTTEIGAPINSVYVREFAKVDYAQITAGGNVTLDMNAAGWHEMSITNCTSTAAGTVGTLVSTNDLITSGGSCAKALVCYVLVYNPAGTQYLNWSGYNWLGASQQALSTGSHVFVITQRSNGVNQTLKIVNYLGKMT